MDSNKDSGDAYFPTAKEDGDRHIYDSGYDFELDRVKTARKNQLSDTDPMFQKDGFIGVDDIDRLRREKLKHETK